MTNENCLEGIKCPKCGYEAAFHIQATVIALVMDDGVEDYGNDTEWGDDDTYIKCDSCGHAGELQDFRRPDRGRYDYVFNISFSLQSDVSPEEFEKDPSKIDTREFRRAIERRMRMLDKEPVPNWYEAVGAPDYVEDSEEELTETKESKDVKSDKTDE